MRMINWYQQMEKLKRKAKALIDLYRHTVFYEETIDVSIRMLATEYDMVGPDNIYFFADSITGNMYEDDDMGLDNIIFWCVYYGLVSDAFLLKNQDIEVQVQRCRTNIGYVRFKSKEPGLLVMKMDGYCVACDVG